MKELGDASASLHEEIAAELAALAPDVLALVGDFVPAFAAQRSRFGGTLLEASDAATMGPRLATALQGHEVVVLKGSRGAALEQVLPAILPRRTTA
jgi:UDP-N-acetylmuramyl pentapeptide synthase